MVRTANTDKLRKRSTRQLDNRITNLQKNRDRLTSRFQSDKISRKQYEKRVKKIHNEISKTYEARSYKKKRKKSY